MWGSELGLAVAQPATVIHTVRYLLQDTGGVQGSELGLAVDTACNSYTHGQILAPGQGRGSELGQAVDTACNSYTHSQILAPGQGRGSELRLAVDTACNSYTHGQILAPGQGRGAGQRVGASRRHSLQQLYTRSDSTCSRTGEGCGAAS